MVKSRPVRAALVVLGCTPIWLLMPVAVAVPSLFLRWREPGQAIEVLTLAIVPLSAVMLAVLVQGAMSNGIRAASTRRSHVGIQWRAATAIAVGVECSIVAATGAVFAVAGLPLPGVIQISCAAMLVAAMLTTVHLWIAVRFSVTLTVAIGIAGTVTGLLVGGTALQHLWWPFVPWAWAGHIEVSRLVFVVPVAIFTTVVAWVLLSHAKLSAAPEG